MVTCFSSLNSQSACKTRLWPLPPHWFFIVLAFGISAVMAVKAQAEEPTPPLEGLAESFLLVAQQDVEKAPKKSKKLRKSKKSKRPQRPSKKRPVVGRKAAEKYFQPGDSEPEEEKPRAETSKDERARSADHFLALHLGGYLKGDAFRWGSSSKASEAGSLTVGVTYRMGEWVRSMDLLFRADYSTFELPDGNPQKLSFLPMIQFPEASSGFPLYFGAGLGLGIFTSQVGDESDVSVDYQLLAGARFFNLFRSLGLFVETGVKNHFHIVSSGQFNSFFLAGGTVFTF